MKPVAICLSRMTRDRREEDMLSPWYEYLNENGIKWDYLDPYRTDIIKKLDDYSALLWHYTNFSNCDLMEAQNIIDIAEKKGLKVFPNHNTGWHFDDKIAEMYEFQRIGAPIPKSWVFYEKDKCEKWLKRKAKYPIIAKLRRGSGSNNVKMIKNASEGFKYCKKMFGKGVSPSQSLIYKTYSKAQSTRNLKILFERAKKVPKWLIARKYSKGMPDERAYCYFQEYIPNDGYDIKVVVVGDKCSYLNRWVRKGDFAASGGGDIFYNESKIPQNVIRAAFETADRMGSQCMGFDFVVDNRTQKGLIVEMCFGFDFDAIKKCGGYWDRKLVWHDEPLDVQREVIKGVLGNL